MMKGFYTAASGLINRSNAVNTIGNNISNSSTSGFKKDDIILKSFGEHMTYKFSNGELKEVGQTSGGVVQDEVYTKFEQGDLIKTDNPLSLAIHGDGFFTVQLSDGTKAYTRNGQLRINQDGYLTDDQGNILLGKNGALKVLTSDFGVTQTGEVYAGGNSIGTLDIVKPFGDKALKKQGESIFVLNDGSQMVNSEAKVLQGYTENSNVDMIKEMTDLMENSRAFQSCSQLVKMMDKIMEKSVNDIARL